MSYIAFCFYLFPQVTVNLFQMQHLQAASLANNLQSLCDGAKLYDPGQEYSEFVRATNSAEEEKVDGWELMLGEIISRHKTFTAKFPIWCQVMFFSNTGRIDFKTFWIFKILFKMWLI